MFGYKNKKGGFTLIELLVVISIIGMLSSIVLSSLNESRNKARLAAGQQFAANIEHTNQMVVGWNFKGDKTKLEVVDATGSNLAPTITNLTGLDLDDGPIASMKSLKFNGTAKYIYLPTPLDLKDVTKGFTFLAWIKLAPDYDLNKVFMGRSSSPYFSINSNKLYLWMGASSMIGNTVLQKEKWYLVAATYTENQKVTLYLDGKIDKESTFTTTPTIALNLPIIVGNYTTSGSYFFKGNIANPRFYKNALTAMEIQEIYAKESSEIVPLALNN